MIKYLIILKGYSERIPRKNFKQIGNWPMYKHLLYELRGEHVFVDTDSEEIFAAISNDEDLGNILPYMRNQTFIDMENDPCYKESPVLCLIEDFLKRFADFNDTIITPHCTSPFLKKETINEAFVQMKERGCISASSVTVHHEFVLMRNTHGYIPVNYDPSVVQRTQDLNPVIHQNGAFFIFNKDTFKVNRHRVSNNHLYHPIQFPDCLEIDTENDLEHARIVHRGMTI